MAVKIDDKYVFYHIPKTGGTSIKHFLNTAYRGNIDHIKGPGHSNLLGKKHCCPLNFSGHVFENSFTMVRHPLAWYESVYKSKAGRNKWYFGKAYQSKTFQAFIEEILRIHPFGFVTSLYSLYVPYCKHILKLENINENIKTLFASWGYDKNIQIAHLNRSKEPDLETLLPSNIKHKLLTIESGITRFLGY